MKNKITIGLLLLGFVTFAQTKTFSGTLEDYTCGDDRCSFGIKKSDGNFYDENITLEFDNAGKAKINPQMQDVVIKDPAHPEYEILNPKYKGKGYTITCTVKNNIYYINKIEDVSQTAKTADSFTKATCKIYNEKGEIIAVCENQMIYSVYNNVKEKEGKGIQNKNEACKGTKCLKVKLDKNGFITVNYLPNVADSKIVGKIVGDKIYSTHGADDIKPAFHATFKGDKNQAALISVMKGFYR